MVDKNDEGYRMTEFIQEEIGALLRASREDQGITIDKAAKMVGVSVEEIVKIEKNVGTVSIGLLQRYAEVLGKKIQLKFL